MSSFQHNQYLTETINMVVRIRLARHGIRNRPFYHIVVANSKSPRDGKHLEKLGVYDPIPGPDGVKSIEWKEDRIKYWLTVGAQPSDTVARLLSRAGILPPLPKTFIKPKRMSVNLPDAANENKPQEVEVSPDEKQTTVAQDSS
ncbi:4194_t:CDS:2 [Acaulospora colombiana]|uniref:4194_t:CDS:1 n=1 Tax=Acaulospora colombiana TaxID=27376 RepID=A0ACA9K866_9GLOM|nr:4194_t:CDS:2 [Acaulospora colombiana]